MISYKQVTANEIATARAGIKKIRRTTNPNINRRMLWCAANLVFLAGAKESEICWFKAKNVLTGNNIVDRITVCWKSTIIPIPLSGKVKKILRNYIRYLQGNKPALDPESPLFPEYFGRYVKGAFAKNLKEFSLKIGQLQRVGAGNYYQTLLKSGVGQVAAEKETETQFRIVEGTGRERNIIYETHTEPTKVEKAEQVKRKSKNILLKLVEGRGRKG